MFLTFVFLGSQGKRHSFTHLTHKRLLASQRPHYGNGDPDTKNLDQHRLVATPRVEKTYIKTSNNLFADFFRNDMFTCKQKT